MVKLKMVLIIPVFLFFALTLGCNNEDNNNALAQPAPISGTDFTGTVNASSEQTCPRLIGGLEANDTLIIEINSTGDMMVMPHLQTAQLTQALSVPG